MLHLKMGQVFLPPLLLLRSCLRQLLLSRRWEPFSPFHTQLMPICSSTSAVYKCRVILAPAAYFPLLPALNPKYIYREDSDPFSPFILPSSARHDLLPPLFFSYDYPDGTSLYLFQHEFRLAEHQ